MPEIEFKKVSKAFSGAAVFKDLSFKMPHGGALCLFGPSGCGKSTVLRLLAGLEDPDSGCVQIGETVVSGNGCFVPPAQRGIGMVFQDLCLWPHMRVARQLDFVLAGTKHSRAERRERCGLLLDRFHLRDKARARVSELSGGEKQRLAIARALAGEPPILLLDEPLANLDAKLRDEALAHLNTLKRSGITMILATHDRSEGEALSDGVLSMKGEEFRQCAWSDLATE